jgi:hypothetical protein
MDARTALKNYAARMLKLYGPDFMDHMDDDDRRTFEILSRKARKMMDARRRSINPDTRIIRTIKGHRPEGIIDPATRSQAWMEHERKYGKVGYTGRLSPVSSIYAGAYVESRPEHVSGRAYPVSSGSSDMASNPADAYDTDAYVTGVTTGDLLRSTQN